MGPISLTTEPSSSLRSLIRFSATCCSTFLKASCIIFSISFILSSMSVNHDPVRLLLPNHSSNGDDIRRTDTRKLYLKYGFSSDRAHCQAPLVVTFPSP